MAKVIVLVIWNRFELCTMDRRKTVHADETSVNARANAIDRFESLNQSSELIANPRYITRISVRAAGKITFVDLSEVVWIQAAENYVQLNTASARYLVHVTIQTLQESLDPTSFLRIHRSLIVNVKDVKELETATHGEFVFVLRNGTRLQSSRTYNDAIKAWASNPF